MAKKARPKGPAAPISKHATVRALEADSRAFYHLQKKLRDEGPEAALTALKEQTPAGAAPERSSMSVTGVIQFFIDPSIERSEKFKQPRHRGALDDLGQLLIGIVAKDPKIPSAEAWGKLRTIAAEGHSVVQEVDDERIWYRSAGKDRPPVGRKGFESRMSRVRKLLK